MKLMKLITLIGMKHSFQHPFPIPLFGGNIIDALSDRVAVHTPPTEKKRLTVILAQPSKFGLYDHLDYFGPGHGISTINATPFGPSTATVLFEGVANASSGDEAASASRELLAEKVSASSRLAAAVAI
ncbi:hypothetical protein ACNOYE_21125 [Nannocystaceae bacterium ST9]